MIANGTNLHKRLNDTEIDNYRSPLSVCKINSSTSIDTLIKKIYFFNILLAVRYFLKYCIKNIK